jgi:hypothetical protein
MTFLEAVFVYEPPVAERELTAVKYERRLWNPADEIQSADEHRYHRVRCIPPDET